MVCKQTSAQTDTTAQHIRCQQYQLIYASLADTSNLKKWNLFEVDISNINLDVSYKHFILRTRVLSSFRSFLKDSSWLYKSIEKDNRSKNDSITYSGEFSSQFCRRNISTEVFPNFNVIIDRFNDSIVFVFTRYIRKGSSFGEHHIFWFNRNQLFAHKIMGWVE